VSASFIEFIGGKYHGSHDTSSLTVGTGYGFYPIGNNMLWDGAEIYDCDNYGIHLNLYVPDHPTNYTRNTSFVIVVFMISTQIRSRRMEGGLWNSSRLVVTRISIRFITM